MKVIFASLGLVLIAGAAFAQQPMGMQQPNPMETKLGTEWGAIQLAQQHFVDALQKAIDETRTLKTTADAERKYWADYVKGLYESKP